MRELVELRQDAAGLASELSQDAYRRAAGLPAAASVAARVRAHGRACNRDGLAQAQELFAEAQDEARDDPTRRSRAMRLGALRDFLVRARALSLEPGAHQEVLDLAQRPSVRPPGDAGLHGALPPVAVERDLPLVRARERRSELEGALADAEAQGSGARAAAWDAAIAALSEAGRGGSGDIAASLQARAWPEEQGGAAQIAEACEALLRDTEPVAQDLGRWLLERHTGARAYPGGAERHDVLHFIHAPSFASAFPRGELLRTCRRWAEMLRLDLDAGRAIQLDEDERPLKAGGAHAFAIDPPSEARLSLWPAEGPRALADLLGALSVAQLRCGAPGDAPPEDLWLGDEGLAHACAALLAGLVREPLFLRRCARTDLKRDDERALAWAELLDARLLAARTLSSLHAHEQGPGARTEDAHRERFARATGGALPAGLALRELDPWLSSWAGLRGRALASHCRALLRQRFDEDWWRNPRALVPLQGLWGRGGRPTVLEVWTELGGTVTLNAISADLLEACR